VASVTGFVDRYRYEPFFQTEVNILGLQILFGLLILGIVAASFFSLYKDVTSVLIQGIIDTAITRAPAASVGATVVSELESLGSRNVTLIVISIIGVTVIFSYVVARITLSPVRNALESQKQFIGNIAHELRTPLSTIKTNTEVALFDTAMSSELRETLESNVEELDRISDIINNLLSLNVSIKPERVAFKNVNLGNVVRTVVGKLRRLTDTKRIEVATRIDENKLVWGNVSALEQIVTNILSNAIRFTPEKGRIDVTVENIDPETVELSIRDSGRGIARKDLFHIFEPFYRADPARSRAHGGGSGLGLTIVSELVKLHNGTIMVRSSEGRGTTVGIRLPVATDGEDAPGNQRSSSEIAIDFSSKDGGT
jgi:signal transduction histidine kinase